MLTYHKQCMDYDTYHGISLFETKHCKGQIVRDSLLFNTRIVDTWITLK